MKPPIPPAPEPEIEDQTSIKVIRYSLPQLLEELKLERSAGSFAMEKLNQAEIGKLFKNKRKKRAKTTS